MSSRPTRGCGRHTAAQWAEFDGQVARARERMRDEVWLHCCADCGERRDAPLYPPPVCCNWEMVPFAPTPEARSAPLGSD